MCSNSLNSLTKKVFNFELFSKFLFYETRIYKPLSLVFLVPEGNSLFSFLEGTYIKCFIYYLGPVYMEVGEPM